MNFEETDPIVESFKHGEHSGMILGFITGFLSGVVFSVIMWLLY